MVSESWEPLSLTPPTSLPWGINLGGGTNSTALVIECFNRGMRPDWILFADTGGERPETYAAIERLGRWCMERDWTPITTTRWIRKDGSFESLEDNCLRTGYMPSKAYGYSGCSSKWKIQPAQRWRKANGFARTVYAVGFDAGEHKRVNKRKCERTLIDQEDTEEYPWYPLYAWGITRAGCEAIIARAGLPPTPKSSCFFCPNMKKAEWDALKAEHADLFARALAIEAAANVKGNTRIGGLCRGAGFLNEDLNVAFHEAKKAAKDLPGQQSLLDTEQEGSCMCSSDGGSDPLDTDATHIVIPINNDYEIALTRLPDALS